MDSRTADVINLADFRRRDTPSPAPILESRTVASVKPSERGTESGDTYAGLASVREPTSTKQALTDIEQMYVLDLEENRNLARALQLLKSSAEQCSAAAQALAQDDVIGADNAISLIQADIPELFLCRSISEGFAAVIVALHHALLNRGGATLTHDQLGAVTNCILLVRENIFLSFNDALNLIDDLEASDLEVSPKETEILGELLAE